MLGSLIFTLFLAPVYFSFLLKKKLKDKDNKPKENFLGLWITGQNLSVPSSVGFIALFGIALQNGMVLVTYLNQLLKEGKTIDEASIEGAKMRLRPVMMTALTTMLGLLPLLIATGTGSEVQRPLATVVIGGLFTSTVLTLIVIPALYKWFPVKVK